MSVAWNANEKTICANARVSMRKKMPLARTANRPMPSARSVATSTPAGSVTKSASVSRRWLAIAAAYAPAPKNAACPSDGRPT